MGAPHLTALSQVLAAEDRLGGLIADAEEQARQAVALAEQRAQEAELETSAAIAQLEQALIAADSRDREQQVARLRTELERVRARYQAVDAATLSRLVALATGLLLESDR